MHGTEVAMHCLPAAAWPPSCGLRPPSKHAGARAGSMAGARLSGVQDSMTFSAAHASVAMQVDRLPHQKGAEPTGEPQS